MLYPIRRVLCYLDGVATPYYEVTGVEAETYVAIVEEALQVLVFFHYSTVVRMQSNRETVPGPNFLYPGQVRKQLLP